MPRFSIDGKRDQSPLCSELTFAPGSKEPRESYDATNGIGQKQMYSENGYQNGIPYDADLVHSAARYHDPTEDMDMDKVSHRKLLTKIDLRVVPVLSIMYLLAFLDRTNISNARIFKMEADLGLVGNQFNVALTIFFGRSHCPKHCTLLQSESRNTSFVRPCSRSRFVVSESNAR